jgi:hypothetical protein
MSADTETQPEAPGLPGRVRVAVGYAFTEAGAEIELERRLHRHAATCRLHLSQVLIDTPGSGRRALDGLVAGLARCRIRHILVPDLADLGDDGTGWLVRRVLEAEFQAVVHTFPAP